MSNDRLPNFLVLGAAKSGTTSLFGVLRQHPEIYMSPVKGPRFFAYEGKHPQYSGPGDKSLANNKIVTELPEYKALFKAATNEKALGEVSPDYLTSHDAAERIKKYIPDAKLIAVLRQPADRAFSNFLWGRTSGREKIEDFKEALSKCDERVAMNWAWGDYLNTGKYFEQLQRYYEIFPQNQIRVFLFEDMIKDTPGFYKNVFSFLGVDENFTPDLSQNVKDSGIIENKFLRSLWENSFSLRSMVRPIIPPPLRQKAFLLVTKNKKKPKLSPSLRNELTDFYRSDIKNLEQLIERDLSSWLVKAA